MPKQLSDRAKRAVEAAQLRRDAKNVKTAGLAPALRGPLFADRAEYDHWLAGNGGKPARGGWHYCK